MTETRPAAGPELERYDTPQHLMAPWFASARTQRRAHYAARPPLRTPPRRAIVTMVHNEAVFLPIWLHYYSRYFAAGDIYVLDNESVDGSTERDGFVRIPVEHDHVDHTWMVRTIEQLQHELLDRYDIVVVTDVDEIIVPAPQLGTLGDYLDRFDEEWVNCLGYELLHMRDREPALQLGRPILGQRRTWYFNGAYDKAAVAMVPMRWRPGFHGREDFQFNSDPDLRLIHLHRMDYEICLERHRTRRRRPWAAEDEDQGWAIHNRITDETEFARWFYEDSGFEGVGGYRMLPEEIHPDWFGRV
jgi:Glycosyl transferase family 2